MLPLLQIKTLLENKITETFSLNLYNHLLEVIVSSKLVPWKTN